MNCEFCNQSLSSKSSLKKHQANAKYCLEIRGKTDEIDRKLKQNQCPNCESCFTTKTNLKRHQVKCDQESHSPSNVYNTVNNNTINNSNNNVLNQVNIYLPPSFTLSDLTPEYCEKILKPLIDSTAVKSIGALMDKAVPGLFKKDGKWLAACSDRSRNSFQVLEKDSEGQVIIQKDPGALKLTQIMQNPLARSVAANMQHASEEVIKEVQDLPCSSVAKDAIKDRLPSSINIEDCLPSTRAVLELHGKNDGLKLLDQAIKKRDQLQQIKEQKQADKSFDEFMGQCHKVGNYYVHSTLKYTVELVNSNCVITGKQLSDGRLSTLSKVDVNDLTKRGYSKYIDGKYN